MLNRPSSRKDSCSSTPRRDGRRSAILFSSRISSTISDIFSFTQKIFRFISLFSSTISEIFCFFLSSIISEIFSLSQKTFRATSLLRFYYFRDIFEHLEDIISCHISSSIPPLPFKRNFVYLQKIFHIYSEFLIHLHFFFFN